MDVLNLFRAAVANDASDVIVTAGSPPVFRINGDLVLAKSEPITTDDAKKLLYGVLRDEQIARLEREKELDFSITVQDIYRFRGNAFFQRGSVGAAFRLIPNRIPSLQELNVPPVVEEYALTPQGMILVTGPTGHGKSTTQAALIDLINQKRRAHIVTIEDPIEFIHKNKSSVIEQREVGDDTHSFASALTHVLRQDPDVILVGEMRDLDTIACALTAAETGHLVISTLHTNDAVQAIDRLLDVFPPHQQGQVRAQLSLSLLAVVAQRLIPRNDAPGRILATEILKNNSAVSNLVREGKAYQIYTVLETHSKEGMKTMDQAIKELYLKGVISYDDARSRMRNPQILK